MQKHAPFIKSIWKPIFPSSDKNVESYGSDEFNLPGEDLAKKLNRSYYDSDYFDITGQGRSNAYPRYGKFFPLNMTEYENILVLDVDVCLKENPDSFVLNNTLQFSATGEIREKGNCCNECKKHEKYCDRFIRSCVFLAKPSEDVFMRLIERAKNGQYIPHTLGDQDVFEAEFPGPKSIHGDPWMRYGHPCDELPPS